MGILHKKPDNKENGKIGSRTIQKRVLLFLRFMLILTTILVMTYSEKGLSFLEPGYIIALIYFVSNLLLYRIPEKTFSKPVVSFFILMFDIAIISLAIYLSEGIETDFYLIYFLAIFIAAVGQDVAGSLFIAIVISLVYGWLLYRANPGISLLDSKFLIRIPFLFIISLISSYWSSFTRQELKKKEELERVNIELKKVIEREIAREIELRRYSERIINSVPTGIIAIKEDGVITTLNSEAERVLGIKKEEAEGFNLKDIKELSLLWAKIERSIKSNVPIKRDEITIKNRKGTLIPIGFSTSTINSIRDQFSGGGVVIFKDLSEIRVLEEKLKHAERFSYLGKMASWVAHEIRNPLTAIDGFAQLILNVKDPSSIENYTQEIQKGAHRINYIIDDILTFARSKEIVYADINLKPLIENIIKDFKAHIVLVGLTSPIVKGERESMRRIFVNLIQNSLDALTEKGKVEIKFSTEGDWVVTMIKDNGKGIAQPDLDRLFTPFFTTKPRGTGLGLAIVKKIIDEHKGKIEIQSEKGKGTTCWVYLLKGKELL